jgi:hypothetical protein
MHLVITGKCEISIFERLLVEYRPAVICSLLCEENLFLQGVLRLKLEVTYTEAKKSKVQFISPSLSLPRRNDTI